MPDNTTDPRIPDDSVNRRHFLKWLAGSPLAAMALPALAPLWPTGDPESPLRPALSHQRSTRCPNCGQQMVYLTPASSHPAQSGGATVQQPGALDVHLTGQLIDSAEDAINVWDFEKVAYTNTLPQHWAYIHMGVDDFETRMANRVGYQRLALKVRRLGPDAAKLDTSVQLFGRRWNTPLFLCPVAALEDGLVVEGGEVASGADAAVE